MADEGIPPDQLSDYFARIGRKGGNTRAKRMTAEERKASATKASKAAGQGSQQESSRTEAEEAMNALRFAGLVIVVLLSREWLRSKRKGP